MNEKEAWDKFFLTGSVKDYLNFKSIEQKKKKNTDAENENIHHGAYNQTTEYR